MAESIIVFFCDAKNEEISSYVFDKMIASIEKPDFWRNGNDDQYSISIYQYNDILSEYDPEDVNQIIKRLGDTPSASFAIEFRRSKGDFAINDGANFARLLLENFKGIVDDTYSELWTYDEIVSKIEKRDGAFLDIYRCR